MIYLYGLKINGGLLINLTSGGDGVRDYVMPKKIRDLITKKNTGKKRTLET